MDDRIAALEEQEGWQTEEYAARIHYEGGTDRYSVEFYAPNDQVLYWEVRDGGRIAIPVGRETVPDPLRTRIRNDLADAGVDPAVEARVL